MMASNPDQSEMAFREMKQQNITLIRALHRLHDTASQLQQRIRQLEGQIEEEREIRRELERAFVRREKDLQRQLSEQELRNLHWQARLSRHEEPQPAPEAGSPGHPLPAGDPGPHRLALQRSELIVLQSLLQWSALTEEQIRVILQREAGENRPMVAAFMTRLLEKFLDEDPDRHVFTEHGRGNTSEYCLNKEYEPFLTGLLASSV